MKRRSFLLVVLLYVFVIWNSLSETVFLPLYNVFFDEVEIALMWLIGAIAVALAYRSYKREELTKS